MFGRTAGGVASALKLTASDAAGGDSAGFSVSIFGDTVVIGANLKDDAGRDSGSAYIFDLDRSADFGDAPAPYPTLRADDGAAHKHIAGFQLGSSIDLESDGQPSLEANADNLANAADEDGVRNVGGGGMTIAGGLRRGDTASQLDVQVTNTAGVAHPYLDAWIDFNHDGDWDDDGERIASQSVVTGTNTIQFAVPYNAALGETFARFRLHTATGPGLLPTGMASAGEVEDHRVLVTFDVTNPAEVAKLLANDAAAEDFFGWSVAMSGDTAVIGAQFSNNEAGSAYVFTRLNGVWVQQAKLTAGDAAAGDRFGYAVSVSSDKIVIGVPANDDAGSESGAAYVYVREWDRYVGATG